MEDLIPDLDEEDAQGTLVQDVDDSPRPKGRRQVSEATLLRIQEFVNTPSRRQSAPQAVQKPKPLGFMGTIKEGAKGTLRALGAAADTYQGDTEEVISAAQSQSAAPKDPDLERFYAHIEEQKQALGDNPSLWEGIKAVGGAAIDNPRGFGLMIAEQLPNSGAALGAGAAGALAGSFGGPVGTVIGGLGGLAAANIGLETGHKALEAAADGDFPLAEQGRVLNEGAIKGGVVSLVDAGTLGVTKFITNASRRAVERATIKTLADNGVDVTNAAARRAAMETPEIAKAVKSAQTLAKEGASKLGTRLAQTGGAVALETIGEGAGEYLGELAATGKANAVDAVIEGFAGLGTSIGEIAATSALNRKGLQRLLDNPEEAESTAKAETEKTGVEHEAIPHPSEPDKFVAVPKVRSVSGIELTRDEEGKLKPVTPVSTQADFNLANKPGFQHTAEDKIRERELASTQSPIILPDAKPETPIIAGKPAGDMSNDALIYTVNRGSARAQKIATDELARRENASIDPAITNAPETPVDTVTRIVATGAEKAQEDAKKIIVPTTAPNAINPVAAPKVDPVAVPEAKKQAKITAPATQATPSGTAEEKMRAAVSAIPRFTLGSWHPITITHNGVTQHLLANQKRAGGNGPGAITLVHVKHGHLAKGLKPVNVETTYKLTKNNELQRVGLPREASAGTMEAWKKAGLPINPKHPAQQTTTPETPRKESPSKPTDNASSPKSSEKDQQQQVKKAEAPKQPKAPEAKAKPQPAKAPPEIPTSAETPPLRTHIADLIKRRAAASQTGKDRTVNNAITRAKEVMDGKRTDTTLESKWFRAHAATMRKTDPATADILSKISEAIKTSPEDAGTASSSKKNSTPDQISIKDIKAGDQFSSVQFGRISPTGGTIERVGTVNIQFGATYMGNAVTGIKLPKAALIGGIIKRDGNILKVIAAKADNAANEKTEKAAKPESPNVAVRGDSRPIPRGGRILANGIVETLQRHGVSALVGQKITSPERLAELAQVYRDPQYETFRIFFTKGNRIVQASGVTARLPGQTPIFPKDMSTQQGVEWIKGMMQSSGADGYWMLHNHPSGNPTPSNADVQVTSQLARMLPGMKGHVVINSNKYAQIMPSRGTVKSQVIEKHFAEDTLLKASKPHEYIGRQIPRPLDAAAIGKSFQKEGWVTLIGTSGVSGVRAIAEIPSKTFTTPGLAKAAIRRFARKTGSGSVFAYGAAADLKAGNATQLTKDGFLRDAVDEAGRAYGVSSGGKAFGRQSGEGGVEARQGESQNQQIDSPAFKKWFRNSKVVDKDGKPLVVYHGTYSDFAEFDVVKRHGKQRHYFSANPAVASEYGGKDEGANVVPVYLSLNKPLTIDFQGGEWASFPVNRLPAAISAEIPEARILRGPGDSAFTSNSAIATAAETLGYDGLITLNVKDGGGAFGQSTPSNVYIAFDPRQIKSAIGNRGTFDDSPFVLNEDQTGPLRSRFDKITDSLIFNFQDRFKPLKDIQKRAGPVSEEEDAALAEERYSGMVRARIDTFEEQMRDPLLKAIHDSKVSYEDVEKYLHALHAPSRNASMREINPTESELKTQTDALEKQRDTLAKDADVQRFLKERRDLRQAEADIEDGIADESLARMIKNELAQIRKIPNVKDYTEALDKLKALRLVKPFEGDNTALSGMSDKEAKAILAKADKEGTRKALDAISGIVDAITSRTRQIYVEGGLEKANAIDAWNNKYEHYVPLHRDEVSGNTMPKVGQGFNIRGKESKRATGSTKDVTNILAHVVAQHEAAIIRSEKARVDRALFQFASTHPDPSLWTLDNAPMLRTVDPVSGFVVERVDPTYKNRPEVLTLKIDGDEHTITFNDQNQEAMRIAASMKNMTSQEMGEVTQMVGRITRFLAMMNTTANPVFVARNFLRDLQTAFVNLSDTEIANKKREVFRDVPAAIKGMWNLSRGKHNSQWAKYAEEFKAAGGQTGWMEHYKDIGARAENLKKELAAMQPGKFNMARRTGKTWWGMVEDANNAVENGARLSAYVAARKAGLSEGKAAQLAKNLTVNFNARGAKSVELNAWYMFMNASIQGSARLIKAMSNKQVRKIVAGVVLSGFLMDIMARSMAGDDDEDGENDYDQLPEHTKAMNFVFMIDSQPVTIPMPYGYNFFASAGRKISEMMFRENYSPVKSATDLAGVFLDAFSPTGQAGSGLQFAAPTVADPFIQWAENKNFAGNPLRRQQNPFGAPNPEFQMGFKSTSAPAKWLAETLNNTTGGNEVRPGFVNVNPAFFDFAVSSIAGGAGRTYMQTVSAPIKVAGNDEIQAREIPFANIFVGARPEHQTERKYFEAVKAVELAEKELKTYRQKGDTEMVREIREEHREELRLTEAAKATKRILAQLRKRDLALDKQDAPNKAQLRKELEDRKREVMARFNKRYREATTTE